VWLAEVVVGAVFLLGGFLLLSRRHAATG
jgi:hypothetical protein